MENHDLDLACRFGNTVVGGVSATTHPKPADKALILAYAAAGICAERQGREETLNTQLAMTNLGSLGGSRTAQATDARLDSQRTYTTAASRYYRAWQHTERVYGLDCKGLSKRDEGLFLVGLITGDLALITDTASGSSVGVPHNIILDVARGAECLDDEMWWGVPSALQAAAWVSIPGTAPEGVDPWAQLEAAAQIGDRAGVRVARALQVFSAANTGDHQLVKESIVAHADAMQTPANPDWILLDQYAYELSLFESDRVWISSVGHRTPDFGEFPGQPEQLDDPFGIDNPFNDESFPPAIQENSP